MDKTCKWTQDEDGIYDTECGNRYEFIEGGPKDNRIKYCGYCGKQIIEDKDNGSS